MQKLAEVCIRAARLRHDACARAGRGGRREQLPAGRGSLALGELPTVSVRTDAAGSSVEEVETQVTQEIEEGGEQIQGMEELRSFRARQGQ